MQFHYIVETETEILSFLKSKGFSTKQIRELMRQKKPIVINGIPFDEDYYLHINDKLDLYLPNEQTDINSVDIPVDVVFENEYFLIINKPKNLSIMRVMAHSDDHLTGRVKHYLESKGESSGIHLVNRLDFETRGIVLFAKNQYIHNLFAKVTFEKNYLATVSGHLSSKSGFVEAPIERMPGDAKRREVRPDGKYAKTGYEVVSEYEDSTLVRFRLYTGRTHQIRVHMAYIGHPLVGDWFYNGPTGEYDLTAYRLKFTFPLDNKEYIFEIPFTKNPLL